MVKVLDACALIVYLEKEAGYKKIEDLLVEAAQSRNTLLMTTVNWGEVFYVLIKKYGFNEGDKIQHIIETFPIDFIPVDLNLARHAALLKSTKKLSYADCFTAALAKIRKAEIVTCDKEFKILENEIKISWLN